MYTPTTSSVSSSLEERLAWMHQPVRLTPGHLPWPVRKMLEAALYCFFCSLEQAILTLVALHRQGKLEPWPQEEPDADAAVMPARSHDRGQLTPAAPKRCAGAQHDQISAEREAERAAGGLAEPAVHASASPAAVRPAAPSWPQMRLGAPAHRPVKRRLTGLRLRPEGRCRSATVCSAAARRWENCV